MRYVFPAGEADLLLGCDMVVSSGFEAMGKVSNQRTNAVVNAAEVPTSAFILNPDMPFPQQAMRDKIEAEIGAERTRFLDSTRIATRLLGDSIASNLFMLGFAWQSGLVPVSAEALSQAIELNGVAVEFNRQAFLWGRRYAHDQQQVEALIKKEKIILPLSFEALIEDRLQRLTDYQDLIYANLYRNRVEQIHAIDTNNNLSLSNAVAKSLYKLMAYKDEYEVARLYGKNDFLMK